MIINDSLAKPRSITIGQKILGRIYSPNFFFNKLNGLSIKKPE